MVRLKTMGEEESNHRWYTVDKDTVFEFPKEAIEIEPEREVILDNNDDMQVVYLDGNVKCCRYAECSSIHDGTLLFVYEAIKRCLYAIRENETDFTVGRIIVTNEYDESGDKFMPKDKPWCRERTTVRVEYKKNHTED